MFAKEVYVNRRNTLKTKVGSGILLFLGTGEAAVNYAGNAYRYRQDSTFNYYFGLTDPDLAAVIDLESGEEIIFGNDVDIDDIIWMGPQPLISDKAASVGVSKTFPLAELEKYVSKAKAGGRKVHFLPPYRYQNMIRLNQMLGVPFDRMRSDASEEFIKAVVSMRLIKEQCEIEEIDKACNIGYAMHFTAMKMARLGMVEQQLVGVMEGIAIAEGLMPSFPIILSQHGETLHNHNHDRRRRGVQHQLLLGLHPYPSVFGQVHHQAEGDLRYRIGCQQPGPQHSPSRHHLHRGTPDRLPPHGPGPDQSRYSQG